MLHRGTRWVMRVSRLKNCGDDDGTAGLVKVFAEWGLNAEPSRLSRWEYGNSRASYRLLRAYEIGCGLPPFLLFALNDRQARSIGHRFSEVSAIDVSEILVVDDIYEIIDRALTGEVVSGSEWYQLATFTSSRNYFYLSPDNAGIVARRLIEELARSLGPAYILRFEALHLFASQPRLYKAFIDQFLEMLKDGYTGTIGDAVSLIRRATPAIRGDLLSRMRESDSPMVRSSHDWIADILKIRGPAKEIPVARAKLVDLTETLCRALPKWAMAHVEVDVTGPLIREALGARFRLQRHEASLLLMLAGVHESLSEQLLNAVEAETDSVLRRRLANLLAYQVPGLNPDRLERLALVEEDPETRQSLWTARGHVLVPIHASDSIVAQLSDPRSQFAITYALGISGSIDDELLDRPGLSDDLRGTLGWWHQRGAAILS